MLKYPKPDPAPPPVAERPRCPWCGKRLRPLLLVDWKDVKTENGHHTEPNRRRWDGRFYGYGAFCSLKCCDFFANEAFGAGYTREAMR